MLPSRQPTVLPVVGPGLTAGWTQFDTIFTRFDASFKRFWRRFGARLAGVGAVLGPLHYGAASCLTKRCLVRPLSEERGQGVEWWLGHGGFMAA